MKRITLSIVFTIFLACLSVLSKAQQPDSVYNNRVKFISKELAIKEETAKSVINILNTFKVKGQQVLKEKNLEESDRKARIDALVQERNQELGKILKPAQMERFLKTTGIDPQQRPPSQ